MDHDQNIEKSLYHFSFLKDIKVYGIYYNSLSRYLSLYPFIKKNHFHDFYSVILITRGKGSIGINTDSYTIEPQTICLLAPNQMHSLDHLENVEGIVFFFCQDFYMEEFSFVRLLNVFSSSLQTEITVCNPCISLSDREFSTINDIIKSIEKEYLSYIPDNNSNIIIRSFLNILLLKLSELCGAKSGKSNPGESTFVHSLSHMVDSYFIKEHNIGFYTSVFNISEKQLNEICNRHFNCGLKKVLQDRLMQEARKLLLSSELSVAEIAYKLNFEDNSYFNKVFKSKTTITPKKFRELHKKFVP